MGKRDMTQLLLVRHGETPHSHGDIICGATEVSLTEYGRYQATLLTNRLQRFHPDIAYSSPQSRAQETAQILADGLGVQIVTCNELREMDFGAWEGCTREYVKARTPVELHLWEMGSWIARPPQGETQQQVIARAVLGLHQILEQYTGQTVLLVSHKTTLRLLIGHMMNWSILQSRHITLSPVGLTIIHLRHDVASLVSLNETAHLSGASPPPAFNS